MLGKQECYNDAMLPATILQQTAARAGEWSIPLILALMCVVVASSLALAVSIGLARRIQAISNQTRSDANDEDRDRDTRSDQ